MDFERREYEYVRKIAETGSFLAAADKLYITQPSLSQFIRRIERHIGAELFDRSHQRDLDGSRADLSGHRRTDTGIV